MEISAATVENRVEGLQKMESGTTMWSSNSACECISKGNEIRTWKRYLHSHVYCHIFFTIAKIGKRPKCPWVDEDVLHLYNGIPSSYDKEILLFDATWMELQGIMRSEIIQGKIRTVSYHLNRKSRKAELLETV